MEKKKLIFRLGGQTYEVGGTTVSPGSVDMESLSEEVKEGLDELNNIQLTDEDMENWFDDDPDNDDPEEGDEEEDD